MTCPSCGTANEPGEKFCGACGVSLLTPRPTPDAGARKAITIVFADLIGSTALHERLDAESARYLMDRYYGALRAVVEAHGGTVVKLLGDGVMAAFGVPRVAEDDAIRAVHAAVAMQQSFRELVHAQGAAMGGAGLRVAVNTGEVVVSAANDDVVGDPVNVAARLQQEARDGDIVIGESTRRLVGALVTLAPLGALTLKGRTDTVAAYRVVSLERPGGTATTFVGRDDELRRITAVYDAAVAAPAGKLVVILGSPGLGKSRLLDEFARRLADGATVLTAHCDAAAGATFAPIAKALRACLGIDDGKAGDAVRAAIEAALPDDDTDRGRIADGIAALLAATPGSPEETFFVVRRLLGALATTRPVVLAIDDLHWAQPLLLDLVEHLVQWSTGVPMLVLTAARPELRDARSSLASAGGLVAEVVTLAGLDAGAATRLAASVIGTEELPAAVAGRVLTTSEGNPLFVGELVRMLVDDGALKREGDRWTVVVEVAALEMPPTIHALLAARIERLRPEERTVLERAAVVGRQFSRAAVAHLLPREAQGDLDARLEALRRSEIIERDAAWFLGEPALRFHHVLTRDAAYRRILKGTRAELHARFADWLEARACEAVEHDETLGWHLEQAHQHLRELGPIDAEGRILGERAARYLAAAGRRALARDDVPVAASLLGRALARLDDADPARADLALDWCEALLAAGDVGPAAGAVDELGRYIDGSDRLRAWHTCFAGQLAALTDPQTLRATADAVATAAEKLATAGDAAGEAKAHSVHAIALARLGKVGACEAALDKALAAARRAHDRRRANAVLAGAPLAALWGPSPVTRASGRCLDVVRVLRITQGAPAVEAVALRCQGVLEALRGRTEAARRMLASSRRMVEELGITQRLLEADVFTGLVDLLEGDAAAAERTLRTAYEGLREHGLAIDAAQAAALLGRALLALGRAEEAEDVSHESEALAGDDLKAAIDWRGVRAEALARRGEHAAAVDFARAAVDIAAATDALLAHADARLALAATLRAAGRSAEAAAEEQRAIELWDAKGATLLAERARRDVGRVVREDPARDVRAAPARPARRLLPNAAVAFTARLDAAIAARDTGAIATLLADGTEEVDHLNGTVVDRQGALTTWRMLLRAEDPTCRHEALGTLGDSLVLCRISISGSRFGGARFDVAAYAQQEIGLIEVDSSGRERWAEFFRDDRLGDGVVRLYERYAERLPDGPARVRAAATARGIASLLGPLDVHSLDTFFAPTAEFVDHRRIVSLGRLRGRDLLRAYRTQFEIADGVTYLHDDVLALRSDAVVLHRSMSGTARAGGGSFETRLFSLLAFDADGLATHSEWFDDDRADQALARFDELASGPSAPRTRFRATQKRTRRIRPNAATANADRFAEAIAARDIDAITAHLADRGELVDHTTGAIYDREASIHTWRSLLRAQDGMYRHEPLATLGDSLALCRVSTSGSGTVGKKFDVGAFETETFVLIEVDREGQRRATEIFAAERLAEAGARLYERYADLLPDGPERDRAAATARSVAALPLGGTFDLDRLERAATWFSPAMEFLDHRTVGPGSVLGAEAHVRGVRALLDLVEDSATRLDDIIALRSDAFIVRWTHFGTDRASGGAFERNVCLLFVFGSDGLVTRGEQFDADREAEALARFDTLMGDAPAVHAARRRVRPNAATANAAAIDAVVAARDPHAPAQLTRLLSEGYESVDHINGGTYDLHGTLATLHAVMQVPDLTSRHEPLATLGDSLALLRDSISAGGVSHGSFDVGAYEYERLVVVETDSAGRGRRGEAFRSDALGDAIARLYAWHAELLPDGPARARAVATARSVAAMEGPLDLDRTAARLDSSIESIDHRTLGTWSSRGAEALLQNFRAWPEVAESITLRIDDVLAARPDALLGRWTIFGTDRVGGGAFERPYLRLVRFGADGRLTRSEIFDVDRDAEALARFDELTAEPVAAPSRVAERHVRRVRENAASENTARTDIALAARDVEALTALIADRCDVTDHVTGITYDRQGVLRTWRSFLTADHLTSRQEPLATLGESLVLVRQLLSARGVARGNFDVGPYESEHVHVYEVDAQGRRRWAERFACGRLGDAVVRLYERYAEILPDGPERERAAATARSVAALIEPFGVDLPRIASALQPAIAFVDHRPLGFESTHGAEQVLTRLGTIPTVATDFSAEVDDILDLRSNGLLVRRTQRGIARDGGGTFETTLLNLWGLGPDGLATHNELFAVDREAEALARFDELMASETTGDAMARRRHAVRPNAATATTARIDAAIAARDEEALAHLFGDAYEVVDHTNAVSHDRRGTLATCHAIMRVPDLTWRQEPFATLGDSLALCRLSIFASGVAHGAFDVGPYEGQRIFLVENDSTGCRRRSEVFPSEHLGAAVIRFYERYAELLPDGLDRDRAAASARSVAALLAPLDVAHIAAALHPAIEFVDHRPLGFESTQGAEPLVARLRTIGTVATDFAVQVDDILGLRSNGLVVRWTQRGTARAGGGSFETTLLGLWVLGPDGLAMHDELFAADHEADALARFDELTAAPTRAVARRKRAVRPNAATANAAAIDAVVAARDPQALAQLERLISDGSEVVDHINGITLDRRGSLASWDAMMRVPGLTSWYEPLATLGDSLALLRLSVSAGGVRRGSFDVGAYEDERIFVAETDSTGRRSRAEVFHAHRLGDAIARLYAWHADLLPDGPARIRAAATARSVAAMVGPVEVARWAPALAPTVEFADHRHVSLESGQGADSYLRSLRALLDVAEVSASRVDDVLALRSDAALIRYMHFGTARDGGGAFERQGLVLWVFGPDGLMARLEFFEIEDDDRALARFDELTGTSTAIRVVEARRLRVQPNAATANAARVDAAMAAGDPDALPGLIADDIEVIDNPTGTTWDREGVLLSWRSLLKARDPSFRQEPLAVLGASLALCRHTTSASGFAGRTFDVGPYEREEFNLIEVDAEGRRRWVELFAPDRVGDAVVRLYERYADLLPDGLERARAAATARSVAAGLGALDLDRMAAVVVRDVEFHDHRSLIGSGLMRGVQRMRDSLATLFDAADGISNRVDDILGLRPDAALLRVTNLGTIRASGGTYERLFLLLWVFGADGLGTHTELFDVDHEDEALARFDALTAIPSPVALSRPAGTRPRRVRPNAATANAARIDAALAARDIDALPSLLTNDAVSFEHNSGVNYERQGILASWRVLLSARDPSYRHEPLATLGDSLTLCRLSISASGFTGRTFDVGAYESEYFLAIEVDAKGRRRRMDGFAADRLGDAVVRLYERHAELLPVGPARIRAATTARAVAAQLGPLDLDRFVSAVAPDVEHHDHRGIVGVGSLRGVHEFRAWFRTLFEAADDIANRVDDVFDLRSDAALLRLTNSGTDRASGGTYERPFLAVWVFGADGLMARCEMFDVGDEAAALVRFGELTGESPATTREVGPSRAAAVRKRRVRPNAATANAARIDAAMAARDVDVLPSLLADHAEMIDHTTGVTYDQRGTIFTWSSLLSARDPTFRHESLATLGASLALCRQTASASGVTGRTWDVGAYEREGLILVEVDAEGRRRHAELYAAHRLGDAVTRLYERYAERFPDGPARDRAAAIARSVAATNGGALDPDRDATAWSPGIEVVDHRILGTWSSRGAESYLRALRSVLEVADAVVWDDDEVLCLTPDAQLTQRTHSGTARVGGGLYERSFLWLRVFDDDGLICRIEFFDTDREDQALARFDELTADPPGTPRIENAATGAVRGFAEAWTARDWARIAAASTPEFHLSDRRTMMHLELDNEQHLASLRTLFEMTSCRLSSQLLATRGERLALFRQRLEGSDRNVGPIEAEWLFVVEVNDRGERIAAAQIDPDDLDAAYAELDERYFAGEAAPFRQAKGLTTFKRRFAARDWDGVASMLAPEYVLVDHRPLGWGTLDGPTYVESLKALADLAPDTEFRIDHHWVSARGQLLVILLLGTREGGAFEEPRVHVSELDDDGRIRRQDFYALDQLDEARARFAELNRDTLRIPPNAATRAGDRHAQALATRDWSALDAVCAPALEFDDRRRSVLLTGDRDMFIASSRLIGGAGTRLERTVLATAGDRLSLEHLRWRGSDDAVPFEADNLSLGEVDAEGRYVAVISFDPDDRRAASMELLERYVRSDAGRWMPAGQVDFRRAMFDHDVDRLRAALCDDYVFHDHRRTGPGRLEGRDGYLAWLGTLFQQSSDAIIEPLYYIATEPRGPIFVAVGHTLGTSNDGGEFESVFVQVVFHRDGRIAGAELFELDDLDAALARYEALRTELAQPPGDTLRIPPNAATRASDRHAQALEARDWGTVDALCAPTLVFDDRRRSVLLTGDRDMFIASGRLIGTAGTRLERTVLATAGDRLSLEHTRFRGSDDAVPFELDNLNLNEVDAEGRFVAVVVFDLDDRRAASMELLERYIRSDAGRWMPAGQVELRRAMFDHDVDRLRAAMCDDHVFHDHRRTGPGRLEGPDGYLAWLGTLFQQSSDAIIEPLYYVATGAHGSVTVGHTLGTLDGGEFESVFVSVVFDRDGRLAGVELFELDDLDAALARFEALRTEAAA